MMRLSSRLFLPLLMVLAATPALAQSDAPVAAPVPVVTTTELPAAAPQVVAPTPGFGQPVDRGIALQTPVTGIGEEAQALVHNILNPVMFSVTIFVMILLAVTMWRFRRAANPVASKTSHNTVIEVVWTLVPVLILVWIAVPSFRLLANQYSPPKADITIKATGHQWYWEYEYPDQGGFSFDSVMLTDAEAGKRGSPKMLDVDNRIVLPVGATVRVLTTAADVIHAFMLPAFWVQMDAVPGRINETWFKAEKPGLYFGQCYQLCGTRHAYMPIAIEIVSKERFAEWTAAKQKENGITPPSAVPAATAAATPVAALAAETIPAAAPAAAPAA